VARDSEVATIERYLARVRAGLLGLSEPEIEDILRELRSHVDERLDAPGANAEEVLRALGEPATLASQYRADKVIERAVCGHSPIEIFHSLYLMAGRKPSSYAIVILAGLGYAGGFVLIGLALDKLLAPRDIGLPGWWFVPSALAAGVGLLVATNRVGVWWIKRWRGGHPPNEAGKMRWQP
jgi:uncharacterized membrane protein